jgi:hypothetical protein
VSDSIWACSANAYSCTCLSRAEHTSPDNLSMDLRSTVALALLTRRHTHFSWDVRLPQSPSPRTRFVQWPLAYPAEQKCALKRALQQPTHPSARLPCGIAPSRGGVFYYTTRAAAHDPFSIVVVSYDDTPAVGRQAAGSGELEAAAGL